MRKKVMMIVVFITGLGFTAWLLGGGKQETESQDRMPRLTPTELVNQILTDLVFIRGGEFRMGTDDIKFLKIPSGGEGYLISGDRSPAHRVRLDGYYISKFLTSEVIYKNYLYAMGELETLAYDDNSYVVRRQEPAVGTWSKARTFCQWLATTSGLPFSLPTEAQWEYAASSRGQYHYPTDNGQFEPGKNYPDRTSFRYRRTFAVNGYDYGYGPLDIADIPVNSLGIHQMGGAESEWTQDWYDPRYYRHSPVDNPMGPETGEKHMARGVSASNALDNDMSKRIGSASVYPRLDYYDSNYIVAFRCVVNSEKSLEELKAIAKAHLAEADG